MYFYFYINLLFWIIFINIKLYSQNKTILFAYFSFLSLKYSSFFTIHLILAIKILKLKETIVHFQSYHYCCIWYLYRLLLISFTATYINSRMIETFWKKNINISVRVVMTPLLQQDKLTLDDFISCCDLIVLPVKSILGVDQVKQTCFSALDHHVYHESAFFYSWIR